MKKPEKTVQIGFHFGNWESAKGSDYLKSDLPHVFRYTESKKVKALFEPPFAFQWAETKTDKGFQLTTNFDILKLWHCDELWIFGHLLSYGMTFSPPYKGFEDFKIAYIPKNEWKGDNHGK